MDGWKADPNDGTPDGRLIYDLWHGRWNFCGCGNPEEVLALLRDRMREIEDKKATADFSPTGLLIAYVLDAGRLTEHGGGVASAWLSDIGRDVLAVLERHGELEDLVDEWQQIGLVKT